MADTDVWALGAISSPAAADRVPIGTGSGAGGHSLRSQFVYADGNGKFIHNAASPNYSINFADVNPARGIVADISNIAGSSLNGAMLSFTQNTINNWCIGQAPGVDAFAIYVGRNGASDGAEVLRITSTGRVGVGTTAPGANLHSVAADGSNLFAVSGSSKGLRVTSDATSISITGVDNTLSGSFQPLTLGGSELRFGTAASGEIIRVTSGGAVGIGTASPGTRLHVKSGSGQIMTLETTNARGAGNSYFGFADATGRKAFVGYGAASDDLHIMNEVSGQLGFGTNATFRWAIDSSGHFYAVADNVYSMGKVGNRISVVYAGTSTISTSDERFKVWIGHAAEDRAAKDRRIARAILEELGWYQFTDAVTEKGPDGARWHYGARAQRIWQIVADEGLAPPLVDVEGILLPDITWTGPVAPAWLCFDGWNDQFEDVYRDVVHVDEVQVGEEGTGEFGPDGAEIMRPITEEVERVEREPTGERELVRAAGHLFGFRVDEMNLLLSWALHDRLSALEEITAA